MSVNTFYNRLVSLQVARGRVQGSLDVSLAVISINKKSNRIDLDAGDILYHMKAKSHELFYIWVTKLQAHRLYKKNEAAHLHSSLLQSLSHPTAVGQAQRNGDLVTMKHENESDSKPQPVQVPDSNSVSACLCFPRAPRGFRIQRAHQECCPQRTPP